MFKQRGLTELINPAIFGYRFHLNWEIKCWKTRLLLDSFPLKTNYIKLCVKILF